MGISRFTVARASCRIARVFASEHPDFLSAAGEILANFLACRDPPDNS